MSVLPHFTFDPATGAWMPFPPPASEPVIETSSRDYRLNPDFEKATHAVWFPCLEASPVTGVHPAYLICDPEGEVTKEDGK